MQEVDWTYIGVKRGEARQFRRDATRQLLVHELRVLWIAAHSIRGRRVPDILKKSGQLICWSVKAAQLRLRGLECLLQLLELFIWRVICHA